MVDIQITGLRFQTRTVLGWLGHLCRKRSLYLSSTTRALFDFGLMFGNFKTDGRDVEHLTFLMPYRFYLG